MDTHAVEHAAETALRVVKRDGNIAQFNPEKIQVAIQKAFEAVEGSGALQSRRVLVEIESITTHAIGVIRHQADGRPLSIEAIQDAVEAALMDAGEHKVARAYILYREEHTKQRADQQEAPATAMTVALHNGQTADLHRHFSDLIEDAAKGLSNVDCEGLLEAALATAFDGIEEGVAMEALLLASRGRIEMEPNYSYLTARILLVKLRHEVKGGLGADSDFPSLDAEYQYLFKSFIEQGILADLLNPQLGTFDLDQLAEALEPRRDNQFGFLGLQTLYDRYFLHSDETRLELPQTFFMRVAMGLALNEDNKTDRAIEFYRLLSSFDFMSSTPTLFNSGTTHSQLSSCYLATVDDDLSSIYKAIHDNAMLSKWAGGLGNDWTPVRSLGAHIKGTNGKSQGVVPFLKVVNDTAVAVNQGGKRKGAVCAYLEAWHMDIEEFLELRKNTGDERRRTHDMNTAAWVPDLLLERMRADKDWTLFSPSDVPDLHDLYGNEFRERYEEYEAQAEAGEIPLFKTISAKQLWRKMLTVLFETGHPWITFKDPCNLRSPQQHVGTVHSSNLCTEITLNTSVDEIAVCNLGSVNLANHVVNGDVDVARLEQTVKTAVRMLDNVVDVNYYAVPQARKSNLRHRPIGLGIMGFQDALYKLGAPYASRRAVEFADKSMEYVSYFAIRTSAELAGERGAYESYEGSLWDQGTLPIDSLADMELHRGADDLDVNLEETLDWVPVRELIAQNGMRNSNVMAIAPTATISNIVGVSQSIEPTYQNLYVKSNLSGEFTVINPALVKELKALGLWDQSMVNDLKFYDGSVQPIDRIPDNLKALFATAFELDARWLVEAAARRQKWIDQAQSLNIYMSEPNGRKLDEIYQLAWVRGLKTTYYLRSLGATGAEKVTAAPAAVQAAPQPQVCSIDEPDCEACQ